MCGIAGVIGGDPSGKEQHYIEHEVGGDLGVAQHALEETVFGVAESRKQRQQEDPGLDG